jgi:hypothetical protein
VSDLKSNSDQTAILDLAFDRSVVLTTLYYGDPVDSGEASSADEADEIFEVLHSFASFLALLLSRDTTLAR